MNKKLIAILCAALVISIAAYFYFRHLEKKKAQVPPIVPPGSPAADPQQSPPQINTSGAGQAALHLETGKFPLKYGSKGKAVQFLQVIVGMKPDGVWGPATDVAMQRLFKVVRNNDSEVTVEEFVTWALMASGSQKWPLVQSSTGNYVKALQIMLDVTIDGKFGAKTAAACTKALGHPQCTKADFETLVTRMLNA